AVSVQRSLNEEPQNRLARARLLPAQVQIAAIRRDVGTIRSAAEELKTIAQTYDAGSVRASALVAEGTLHLLEKRSGEAVRLPRRASGLWKEMNLPYEAAATALVLADAYLAEGDPESARMELEMAEAAFERLGALPALDRAKLMLRQIAESEG